LIWETLQNLANIIQFSISIIYLFTSYSGVNFLFHVALAVPTLKSDSRSEFMHRLSVVKHSTFLIPNENERRGSRQQDVVTPSFTPEFGSSPPDLILANRLETELKLERLAKRRRWIRDNRMLLRSMLAYSVQHGAAGGGIASVRMELLLLLHEIHHNKLCIELESNLPLPTTFPLLSACISRVNTTFADPLYYLRSMMKELLRVIIQFELVPSYKVLFCTSFTAIVICCNVDNIKISNCYNCTKFTYI